MTDVAAPGANASTTITYVVTSGLTDLDDVELYFRRNGIGTFNRYTDADNGNPEGKFAPQVGNTGTIFDSQKWVATGPTSSIPSVLIRRETARPYLYPPRHHPRAMQV